LHVGTKGNSSLIPILATISGYAVKLSVAKGAFAAPNGISLFEVVDNNKRCI